MTAVATPPPSAPAKPARFAYIPGLDGHRGVWVIFGPILYHARPDWVPGGILSLDLFFVLSSYLIVSILLNEWDRTGRIDLVAYAGRRVRRLLPALLVLLGFLTTWLVVTGDAAKVPRWTGAIVSALTYSANWYDVFSGVSYFDQFTNPSPLKHVWSFAVEEQFYVFAPFFLILGLKLFRGRARLWLAGIATAGALASAAWMSALYKGGDPSRVYYGTDTRAQALFVGIALAIVRHQYGPVRTAWGRRVLTVAMYGAVAFFVWAIFTIGFQSAWMFDRLGFLLIAVVTAVIALGQSEPGRDPLRRFFELPPIRYTGRISYGLYMYHWPVYLLLVKLDRLHDSNWWLLAGVGLTFAFASASFHFVEQPFLQKRWPIAWTRVDPWPGAFAASVGVLAIVGGLLYANTRIDTGTAQQQRVVVIPPVDLTDTSRPLRVLVVGDSVGKRLGEGLEAWAAANPGQVVVLNHAHNGCGITRSGMGRVAKGEGLAGDEGPTSPICGAWADEVPAEKLGDPDVVSYATAVKAFRPDVVVATISPWDAIDRKIDGIDGGEWTWPGRPGYDAYVRSEYRAAAQLLTSTGAKLVWVPTPYLDRTPAPQRDPARFDRLNALALETSAGSSAGTLDYAGWLGPVGGAHDKAVRSDGIHPGGSGLGELSGWAMPQLLALGKRTG